MKKSLKSIFAMSLAFCFFCSFTFFTGAAERLGEVIGSSYLASDEEYLIEYDYINKTERILFAKDIPDYAATTTTTYDLSCMSSELATMNNPQAETFSIIDPTTPFSLTPPKVNDVPQTPYSGVVCLLLGYELNGQMYYYRGTGFLAASDVLVTAGHNVVNLETPIVQVRVYPYVNQASRPDLDDDFFVYPSRWVCADYANALRENPDEAPDYDWCVMKLQQPISGAYCFPCSYDIEDVLSEPFFISGYPHCIDTTCNDDNCLHQDYFQVTSGGYAEAITDKRLWYSHNTKGGNSGSPVYNVYTNTCYAIHAYGRTMQGLEYSTVWNSATLISPTIYNLICTYMES